MFIINHDASPYILCLRSCIHDELCSQCLRDLSPCIFCLSNSFETVSLFSNSYLLVEFSSLRYKMSSLGRKKDLCTWYWWGSRPIVSTGIRTSIHGLRDELSTYRWATWFADELAYSSVYQVQKMLFTNQLGVRNCHKMNNCETFRTKCCVK